MQGFPKTKLAQGLFFFNGLIWLVFGFYTLWGMAGRYPGHMLVYFVGILVLGNAAALALSGFLLGTPNKWFFHLAVFVLLANILLTFTDQFGFFDFTTLVIDLVLLGILISIRKQYLSPS